MKIAVIGSGKEEFLEKLFKTSSHKNSMLMLGEDVQHCEETEADIIIIAAQNREEARTLKNEINPQSTYYDYDRSCECTPWKYVFEIVKEKKQDENSFNPLRTISKMFHQYTQPKEIEMKEMTSDSKCDDYVPPKCNA